MNDKIIITNKSAVKIIDKIFTHENEIYSIYFKDNREVVWIQGKTYIFLFTTS